MSAAATRVFCNMKAWTRPLTLLGCCWLLTGLLAGTAHGFQNGFTPNGGSSSSASGRFSENARFTEYERQLNAILKTRRDEEKIFVAKVVAKVRAGKIPTKLVSTSFDWVNKKRPGTKYPFIYFEKILRLQAKQLEIEKEVPPFDFSIYRKSVGQLSAGARGSAGQPTEVRRASFWTPGTRLRELFR